jgi:hypothetical protein
MVTAVRFIQGMVAVLQCLSIALLNVKYTTECQNLAVEGYVILSSHGGSCDQLENVNPIVYNAPDAPSGAPPWWC